MGWFTLQPQRLSRKSSSSGAVGASVALFPPGVSASSAGSGWTGPYEATAASGVLLQEQSKLQQPSSKLRTCEENINSSVTSR